MSESMHPEDERTLEMIRRAVAEPGDASEEVVQMVMMGYDLTVSNGPIAIVAEDTALTGLVAVRAGYGEEPRFVSCQADGVLFEFEIEKSRVIGTIDPPQAGRIVLQRPEPAASCEIGRSGSFELALDGTSPFRLVYETEAGESIATEWLLP